MKRYLILWVGLFLIKTASAQTTMYYFDPVAPTVTSGVAAVPYSIPLSASGPNYIFKAEDEITILPNPATTESLITSGASTGAIYFHAYLVPPVSYAELNTTLDGSMYATIDNRLYFRYYEKYNSLGALSYKVYNYSREEVVGLTLKYNNTPISSLQSLVLGANYLALDFTAASVANKVYNTNDTDSIYILEVSNSKAEKSYLRFKLIKIN